MRFVPEWGGKKKRMLHPGPLLIESEPRECRELLSPRTPKGNMQRYADMSLTMDGIDSYENPHPEPSPLAKSDPSGLRPAPDGRDK
jgi:hypothetical protein